MNKDNLYNLFQNIDLDEPSVDFSAKVMDKVENIAQPNKISLKTFMVLIIGAAAVVSSSLIIIFKDDVLFFIQKFIAPYILKAMRFLNNITWPEINNLSLIMTIISCLALMFALVQFFARKSREASNNN
ncbi:MAG: hypothetical protein LBP67_07855 [Bacteroidales bacterium]|jgi:hypothetical protein|nr:hypothetical protein [Bacteroidales bacterium]